MVSNLRVWGCFYNFYSLICWWQHTEDFSSVCCYFLWVEVRLLVSFYFYSINFQNVEYFMNQSPDIHFRNISKLPLKYIVSPSKHHQKRSRMQSQQRPTPLHNKIAKQKRSSPGLQSPRKLRSHNT